MADAVFTSQSLYNTWSGLGVTLSTEFAAASAALDASLAAQLPDTYPQPDHIDASTVAAKILAYAEELAVADSFRGAQTAVSRGLAGRVLRAAAADLPNVLTQLQPRFDAAAKTFVKAVAGLDPQILDSDSLVAAGLDSVKAFSDCRASQSELEGIRVFLRTTRALPGGDGIGTLPDYLTLVEPQGAEAWRQLVLIDRPAQTLPGLSAELVAAARAGCRFRLTTVTEADTLRAKLEADWAQARSVGQRAAWPSAARPVA